MIVDFDPEEGIVFPQPVTPKMPSREFMAAIRATEVPQDRTAMWHLGQNGWILKSAAGTLIAIDPYLTDYCASKKTGEKKPKSRLLPVFVEPEDLQVDAVLITHSHPDHCDPYTLERLSIKSTARFFAPWQAAALIRQAGIPETNLTVMHPLQQEDFQGIQILGAFAEPTDFTDLNHMGFGLKFPNGQVYYNTGDTAASEVLAHVAAWKPQWMCVCINGGYHNLSHWEAAEIAARIQPKTVVPAHYDMMPHNLQSPHMFRKSLYEKAPGIEYVRMNYYQAYFF